MRKQAHQPRKGGAVLQIIERYGVSAGGLPVLEKAHWKQASDPRAQRLLGQIGRWILIGVECPLANTALFEKYGVRDPATDYMKLEIPENADYWNYYACPLKDGFQIVERAEFLEKLAEWNAKLDAGDLSAWDAVQASSYSEYRRLMQLGWPEQLALTLSGFLKPAAIVEA